MRVATIAEGFSIIGSDHDSLVIARYCISKDFQARQSYASIHIGGEQGGVARQGKVITQDRISVPIQTMQNQTIVRINASDILPDAKRFEEECFGLLQPSRFIGDQSGQL